MKKNCLRFINTFEKDISVKFLIMKAHELQFIPTAPKILTLNLSLVIFLILSVPCL